MFLPLAMFNFLVLVSGSGNVSLAGYYSEPKCLSLGLVSGSGRVSLPGLFSLQPSHNPKSIL